jgi:hypothetical protein
MPFLVQQVFLAVRSQLNCAARFCLVPPTRTESRIIQDRMSHVRQLSAIVRAYEERSVSCYRQ